MTKHVSSKGVPSWLHSQANWRLRLGSRFQLTSDRSIEVRFKGGEGQSAVIEGCRSAQESAVWKCVYHFSLQTSCIRYAFLRGEIAMLIRSSRIMNKNTQEAVVTMQDWYMMYCFRWCPSSQLICPKLLPARSWQQAWGVNPLVLILIHHLCTEDTLRYPVCQISNLAAFL